jgi:glycosyltransferase involved in cell wall biosynthesis/SAM-dependent methyltransferase
MRVLIVTHFLGQSYAHGQERVIARLSTELLRQGDDVALVTTWDQPAPRSSPRPVRLVPGVTVFRLSHVPRDPLGLPLDSSTSNSELDQILDDWRPDIVHITLLYGLDPAIVGHIQRRGTPVVLDFHSHELGCPRLTLRTTAGDLCAGPDGGRACVATCFAELPDAAARITARARAIRDAVAAADVRTASSPYLARWIHETCDVSEPRTVSPPIAPPRPGLPVELRPTPATRGRLNLAQIGEVLAYKGADIAVEAVAGATLGSTQLTILGPVHDRSFETAMRIRAAEAGDLELRITGAFEPGELSLLLSDVDVLVIPSQFPETYSLAAREAWSRGVPVLASRLGALAEAVREGENGFTFQHDDPRELGRLLERVVHESGLLARLRDGAARTPVVTPPQYAAAFGEIYREVLGVELVSYTHALTGGRSAPLGVARSAATTAGTQRWRYRRDRSEYSEVFTDIYARDLWRLGGESSSGPGGQREQTQGLRLELPRLLSRLGIRSILDVGCGDFNWMRETELGVDVYIGVDIVFGILLANRLRYGGPRKRFLLRDVMRDPLPRADLVLCRDVLIHFPDDDLVTALNAIISSGARYLLASTFIHRDENKPIGLGDWRPVNLELPPLSLPPPLEALVETPRETGYDDKRLGLWDLREFRGG